MASGAFLSCPGATARFPLAVVSAVALLMLAASRRARCMMFKPAMDFGLDPDAKSGPDARFRPPGTFGRNFELTILVCLLFFFFLNRARLCLSIGSASA